MVTEWSLYRAPAAVCSRGRLVAAVSIPFLCTLDEDVVGQIFFSCLIVTGVVNRSTTTCLKFTDKMTPSLLSTLDRYPAYPSWWCYV